MTGFHRVRVSAAVLWALAIAVGCGDAGPPDRADGAPLAIVAENTVASAPAEVVASYTFAFPIASLAPAPSIRWELPDGRVIRAERLRVERRANGFTWFGSTAGDRLGSAFVTVVDGRAAGRIETRSQGVFQIRRGEGEEYLLREIEQDALPPCGTPDAEPLPFGLPPPAADRGPSRDDGSVIRVMIVYNAAAKAAVADIDAEVQAAIDDANQVYADSDVSTRLELAYTQEVSYAHSGDLCFDRQALAGVDDGALDEVHALRDLYQADLVALLTEQSSYCGCAYIMEAVDPSYAVYGFTATAIDCAVFNHSFVHEIGHNQGMRHDWYVDPTDNSPFTYNHGFAVPAAGFRTVMAYNDVCLHDGFTCVRLGYLSNPDLTFGDSALGLAEGLPLAADNHKVLGNTALTVANYRTGPESTSTTAPTTTTTTQASTTTSTIPSDDDADDDWDDDTDDDGDDDIGDDDADDDTSQDDVPPPDLGDDEDDSADESLRAADSADDSCGCGC